MLDEKYHLEPAKPAFGFMTSKKMEELVAETEKAEEPVFEDKKE